MFPNKVSSDGKRRQLRHRIVVIGIIAIIVIITLSFTFTSFASKRSKIAPTASISAKPSNDSISLYGQNGARNYVELFQAIKSMTIQFNFTYDNNGTISASSERITYSVAMASTDDGMPAYKVNLTDTGMDDSNKMYTESALVWIDPTSSSILQVSSEGKTWIGAAAQNESRILSFITADYWLSLLNSSNVVPMVSGTTANSVSFGSVQLRTTTYQNLPSLTQYENLMITVGSIPQNGMQIVVSCVYNVPGGGSASFRLLSLQTNQ
jgi:hypothetical protein